MQGRKPDNPISNLDKPARKKNKKARLGRDERRSKGRQLLAMAFARDMGVEEAIDHVRRQEILRDPDTGMLPTRRTVHVWYRDLNLRDLQINDGEMIERETERERCLARYKKAIIWWRSQVTDLECQLQDELDPEKIDDIRTRIGRCHNQQMKFEDKLITILHLDKDAPLEQLDDPDLRELVRNQISTSLAAFDLAELIQWKEMFEQAINVKLITENKVELNPVDEIMGD